MKLDHALERAGAVKGEKAAAQLYNSIEYELALGDYNEDEATQGEQALALLEDRYPGVRAAARDSTTPPDLSRQAGGTLASEPAPLAAGPREATTTAPRPRTARARAARATSIHARPSRRRTSLGGGTFGRARGASEGVGQAVIHGVEGIVGLVLLSLLVSPRGSQAITASFGLVGRLLGRVASPTGDPLAGLSHKAGGGGAGSHDTPFTPKFSRKRPPPAPPGARSRFPRPVPFPNVPAPSGSPWSALGDPFPSPAEVVP